MVPFTPRLIPAILPNLAHHVAMIQSAAIRTNKLLLSVIQKLPSPQEPQAKPAPDLKPVATSATKLPRSPTPTTTTTPSTSRQSTTNSQLSKEISPPDSATDGTQGPQVQRTRANTGNADPSMTPRPAPVAEIYTTSNAGSSRPHSPLSFSSQSGTNPNGLMSNSQQIEEGDPFDYQATVNELTIQFLSEFEETRVAALKWLIMLHQKAPKKV